MVTENGQSDGNTSFLRAARNGQLDKVLEHLKSNIDINTSNSNGLNALHLASKDGHVTIVEELLKRGAVVDAATKKGNTALHIASLAGQEEVVKLLVQHGASVNVQSQNGFTPLYMAAQENHDNVVKYLLANGANQSLSTEDGFTPLAVAMQQGHDKVVTVLLENDTRGKIRLPALHIAAKKDDVKAAKLLLENEHNPDVTSKSGFTPLHIASHYGNQQIANLLIQKGADVNYAAKHNITPLHVAAKWGKSNMVALLLEHAATIDAKTRDGLTPLHCAARSGHEQVVDMLLERGAPISSKTKNGLAPLHMSAQGDHVDAARILLYHRAPVDEVTVDYLTALHVAAHCGHVRVAKLLLDRQADANARALNGFTPLHIACKKNRIKVVELLLKHGASIGATTESGLTPLHVASFMGCMNIVIYLLQHDANPDVPTVRGETPLHLAARANQTDIIRILLRNGSQVDARAREQQTPLHIASRLGNVDIVMLLLQHGAKVDNTTKDMYTSLHIAAKEGQDEVAGVLLENGASLDATTKKGFSPLHLAAKYGHLKVAKLLLQKEAPVDAQGKNGVTPLHVASHYDHQNVALLLLDKGASPHAAAKNGHTPLHIAARKNQMDIANTLLEYGAKPNAESKAGFTPLHLSAQEGHADMSALLLEHKGDANYEAKNGLTPLHLCAQEDRVPVAEVLVKNGANVNCATKGGYTPLHIASHYGQVNMVKFLLKNGADIESKTSLNYTPLHQAAQQGHATIVNILLEHNADPNAVTTNGQTPLNIAQKLGYITVIETLKVVTTVTNITTTTTINIEEKYKVQAPELMHETFMSDSEEEGGEDTVLGDHTYRYLTADEMKSLGDDSLPIDVTRDERIDSNRMVSSSDSMPPLIIEDTVSPEHITQNYVEYLKKYAPDNVDINKLPINIGKLHWKNFLVSFLVDARGGAMRGCRHSGVRVIVPPRCAPSPTRITCRYVRPQRTPHPPPLMEGEALASRVLELGPVGARFLGPVIIEVPHFAALRGKEREIVILRSDNGESWKEHSVDASEEILNQVLHDSFEADDLSQLEDVSSGRITRIVTQDFPQYFAVVSRVRQEVHAIGPEGGMVSSTVVPQVQAVFPEGALTKKIKVGLQAQPIDPELTAKLLGHGVAVSPVVTVEPRRRKFHKAITLSMPAPRAHSQGMINQYSGSAPTLRLLCSITGGTTRAQWEDVTGSTPLTFVNDCVSFTTTVSARFWLMDCRNIGDATKMATELYKEAIHVPFMAKFVVFAKRVDPLEARLRVFCMTDDKEDKTLEHQEHFTEVAKSRDVEVLEGKQQFVEFAGNLVPITKSGEQLSFSFRAFKENRLPFSVRVKDQHAEAVSRCLFMKEPKVPKGEPPQQPICILNIVLPEDIVTDTISLTDSDSVKHYRFLSENFDYYRPDPRLADMSNLLGEDWVSLANQLGLTTSEINVIKSEYPDSVAKQAQSMLRMWLSQTGNKAQTNTLENALKRIGREDIIPQCLNVDQGGQTITRIKQEEIGKYRLKKDVDSIEKEKGAVKEDVAPRAVLDIQEVNRFGIKDKYSAEEKVFVKSDEDEEEEQFDKPVAERREKIVKRLSAERTIPASSQRREIVQEITTIKEQNLVEDKIAEVLGREKTTDDITTKTITKTIVTPEIKTVSKTVGIKTTPPSESTVSEPTLSPEQTQVGKATVVTDTRTIQLEEPHKLSEDAELLEKVTQSFEKKKPIPKLIADEDPKSPKFSKTPPPSPADFITREQVASVQEWETTRQPLNLEPTAPPIAKDAAQQETSCDLLTEAASPLTSETKQLPQPKPRTTTKSSDAPLEIIEPHEDNTKEDKPKSPVRDDLLDTDDTLETYSDKKKFWENVTQESQKRINLQENGVVEKPLLIKKRVSIHELGAPPVPKPRTVLQTSKSLIESDSDITSDLFQPSHDEYKQVSVKDRTVSFESSTSESSGQVQTDLTRISESDTSFQEEKIMSEYQASYQIPSERKTSPKSTDLHKTESIDSDKAQKGSSLMDNTGYISDSEDVEHYISDSEIEDRVPQIRDRLMSVFVPSASSTRKSLYERSASLPTEDLYEVSARAIKARKDYYEEQIRKEMIEEQLTSEIEEEPSPERKNLLSSMDDEHTDADARSIGEDTDELVEESAKTVSKIAEMFELSASSDKTSEEKKSVAKTFKESMEDKESRTQDSDLSEQEDKEPIKMSVKDLAKGYEKQLGNVIAGQRVSFLKETTIDKQKDDKEKYETPPDVVSFIESTDPAITSHETHKTLQLVEDQLSLSPTILSKTHKDNEADDQHPNIYETQQSVSSDKSTDLLDGSYSTKIDSMEVLVDKSEIEDTEKISDIDPDLEAKSFDSLDQEHSPKQIPDESIPEITVTLSGKQRRISEESDESEPKVEQVDIHSPIKEKSDDESPIKVPQENIQDTVWEVSIESHTGMEFTESVKELSEKFPTFIDEKQDKFTEIQSNLKKRTSEDDLSADITQKFISEEIRMAQKIAKDEEDDLQEIAKEKRQEMMEECDDLREMLNEQQEISSLLETKLLHQSAAPIDDSINTEPAEDSLKFSAERDDFSSSAKDESELGSEIHQDHSDSFELDKIKSDAQTDIEKIILDSLYQQKVHPEEAKKIASALVEEIEAEMQKRDASPQEFIQKSIQASEKGQVADFLKHLAETKGLDEREIELVESVLARRQRELGKLSRGDTQASSMEITDEDLKYSGAEADYSYILEQINQLEAEKIGDVKLEDNTSDDQTKRFQDRTEYVNKIDEARTEETKSFQDFMSREDSKTKAIKQNIFAVSSETVTAEKSLSETTDVFISPDKILADMLAKEKETVKTHLDVEVEETIHVVSDEREVLEKELQKIDASLEQDTDKITKKGILCTDTTTFESLVSEESKKDTSLITTKFETDLKSIEKTGTSVTETSIKVTTEADEISLEEEISTSEKIEITHKDEHKETESNIEIDKTHLVKTSTITQKDQTHREITVSTTSTKSPEELDKVLTTSEIIKTHETIKRTSSSESKSSSDIKSPSETIKKDETDAYKSSPVIMRKGISEPESSSNSSNLKPDRKSGIEFESYSSSGESHYHSFEIDSSKSRPCSSDVEGLIAAGSSEYESALTSQDYSARSHITSTEYQTAVSSMSSKESMKSLDSESSGNLASVEASEHSETLVPSTSDLDDILDSVDQQLLDEVEQSSAWTAHGPARQSTEVSDSEILSYTGVGESVDISEEDEVHIPDTQSKMKRSHEMTFQPEPRILVPESPQGETEDKLGTSVDEGSLLSVSVSSTSSTGAQRTVIELSRADSERGSLTVSGTSEHLSLDDVDNITRGSRESLIITPTSHTTDIGTSTGYIQHDLPVESVTLTTTTIDENGIQSVSTQVTSETQSPVDEQVTIVKYEEPKKKGHRRNESTFVSSMISTNTRAEVVRKIQSDLAESDKYTSKLSFKETSNDEKKDVDESEKDEYYETEADQGFHRDLREGRYFETESDNEQDNLDLSRPQSHLSKSDSERPPSTGDSELADLVKSSDCTEITDPIERPASPDPLDKHKDDTPELSSEDKASIGELEQEYSSAVLRSHETHFETRRSISDICPPKDALEKRDSHGKSSSTSSEKSSFEEAEAEAAFSMVAHISPAHKIKQICPILEDEDAEKHEIETRERAQKELEERRERMMKDLSPGFVPDIKITQHMAPLVDKSFRYPELELEAKEKLEEDSPAGPDTPASVSSKSSEETDQGREYVLDQTISSISEEPESKMISKSEGVTAIESTVREGSEKGTDTPSSDSFEMLEKPDLIDDFVVIEEVGKEAHEFDSEGKSVQIGKIAQKEKHDVEVERYLAHSAPTPLTKMTDIKYYPDGTSSSEELAFDFEESPPQDQNGSNRTSTVDYGTEYDRELEANRKWMEQQFQGDQAALRAAGYGYEMEFERGPLEDIKEEDINDLAASSYGSQRDSGGSIKDSFSSTPEYDVLAGKKYFTRSGDHDDISMSSLQEFENLEKAMSLEMRRFHQGSQDSSSNGSFKSRYLANKGGQGDDISVSSLKEFEGLEKACIAAHKIEIIVKEEEALLAQIEEGQESITSESESCETISGTEKKIIDTDDEEDYEKRMFEIDEIIKQAQSNVERFIDLKETDKTESLGRGDSIEEVSKVPELDLDAPLVRSTVKVQWKEADNVMVTSTDSLDLKPDKPSHHDSTDSLDQKTGGDVMTASTDSIEFQVQKSAKDIMTDSIEIKPEDKSYMVSSDSLELAAATSSGNNVLLSDSIDEDGSRIGGFGDHSSSSTGKDFSSSGKEDEIEHDMVQSVTSSTATHATYQYDTDSVYSGSFTSGGSNTMVSSTNSIDQTRQSTSVDVAAAVKKVWFDEDVNGRRTTEYVDDSKPYVTEIIEPVEDESFSHIVHRRIDLPPDVKKITFTGSEAEDQMRQFIQNFNEGEQVFETEEIDEAGNIHVKRVVQKKFIVRDDGSDQPLKGSEIEDYFKRLNKPELIQGQGVISKTTDARGVITKTVTDGQGTTTMTQQFDLPQLTTLTRTGADGTATSPSTKDTAAPSTSRPQVTRRRPLRYEISVEDQTEVDPREHDWRFNLPKHAEGEEGAEKEETEHERRVADQHQLSEEMKQLLKELEKETKQ
ncbi:ankyrin-2-like isoform X33 [Diorhabda carinulata]|uniref:ankyrin-2-like isoform X33 n=1 Tax=Diorhabda carinulata TaxID=1163345 RepID=UPI0025A095C8|nr:ankyrin-2-like isoform X33 [Diorhabda carinulata]